MPSSAVVHAAYEATAEPLPDTAANEYESAETITHIQLPVSVMEEMTTESDANAFWEYIKQNYPDVHTIEFYDETGEVIWALVTEHSMADVDNIYLNDLDEAIALHKADNLAMPTYLPDGFVFERAWFSNFSCPISDPNAEFAGGQLFVVYGDGEQNLTLEIRYHPEDGGFDIWTSCENLEEITISGRNAIVGDDGLSVQVTHNARYTFMTGPFAGAEGSTISPEELVKIAESIESLQRVGFTRMDYDSFSGWSNQRLAAYTASGNYSDEVIAMYRADYQRDLEAIRNGYYMYLFENSDGTDVIRYLFNPANGEFAYHFGYNDEGRYIAINPSDVNPFFTTQVNS